MKALLAILTLSSLAGCAVVEPQAHWEYLKLESIALSSEATPATGRMFRLHYKPLDKVGLGWDVFQQDTSGFRVGQVEKVLVQSK